MLVSAITSIRSTTPLRKAAKTAKVSKRAVAAADADEKPRKSVKSAAKDAGLDHQAPPKSAAAMSSSGVQAALTFLKAGG